MLYLIAEISVFLFLAGLIGLFTGLFLHRQVSALGMQEIIEDWRARLSRSESKLHALHISQKELLGATRDQDAELVARAGRLQASQREIRSLRERLEKAKAEVSTQWKQSEEAEERRKGEERGWQELLEAKTKEAETLASALRSGTSATTVKSSEELESLKLMLGERDTLIAVLQRRLQSLELLSGKASVAESPSDHDLDMDRNLFLMGEEEEMDETQELGVLASQIPTEDLTQIKGLGSATERRLNELGIYTYEQIATWTESDVDYWAGRLETPPDLIRELAWVEQAKALLR